VTWTTCDLSDERLRPGDLLCADEDGIVVLPEAGGEAAS